MIHDMDNLERYTMNDLTQEYSRMSGYIKELDLAIHTLNCQTKTTVTVNGLPFAISSRIEVGQSVKNELMATLGNAASDYMDDRRKIMDRMKVVIGEMK